MNSGCFHKLHFGGGKFNLLCHLVLREFLLKSLAELFKIFEELLAHPGSNAKRRSEFLLAQDAKVELNSLQVGLGVACVVHQVTSVLIALGEPDLDTVWLCEPLGVLKLCVGDGRPLSDSPAFAILVLDVIWPNDAHLSK